MHFEIGMVLDVKMPSSPLHFLLHHRHLQTLFDKIMSLDVIELDTTFLFLILHLTGFVQSAIHIKKQR